MGGSSFLYVGNHEIVDDFVRITSDMQVGVQESIITDNGENLNSHLMRVICEQFKITHRNSSAYRPQINGV